MLISVNRFKNLTAAPKDLKANKAYRAQILRIAELSPSFREECWIRAKHDFVWYVNTFGYTYNTKQHPTSPQRIFILREYQEDLSRTLIASVGKHDVIIPKARDMGASWVCLSVLAWYWQFNRMFTALLGSWKQDYVDKRGDPSSLFWKLDYFIKSQPIWMRPRIRTGVERTQNNLLNPFMDSAITGEATNPDFGRASRPAVIMLDELAAVDCAYEVLKATGDATNTRWMISTYAGAFGAFYDQVNKKREHNPDHLVELHWTLHPGKRRGLYQYVNDKLIIHDKSYHFPVDEKGNYTYKFINSGTTDFRSPWYDERCLKAGSPQEIAQELDMKPQGSASEFVSTIICNSIVQRQARPARHRGFFKFTNVMTDEIAFEEDSNGDVEIWVTLDHKFRAVMEQFTAGGADVAQGTVNKTGSNSVFSIYGSSTNEKICQITTNSKAPEAFARYVVAACRFFAGPGGVGTMLNWERNGPGNAFSIEIVNVLKYGHVWMSRDINKLKPKPTDKPGWSSNNESKKSLLNAYRSALMEDRITNRKMEAIMECAQYLNYHGLRYEHNKAINSQDESTSGDNHGDMVIADALAYLALTDLPVVQVVAKPQIPETSFAGLEARRLAEDRAKRGGSWNFQKR